MSVPPEGCAFLQEQLRNLAELTRRNADTLLQQDDPLNPRVQALQRIYLSQLDKYPKLLEKLHKFLAAAPEPASLPLLPDAWASDPVRFAREALGLELFPHQQELCLSAHRINLLIAGRGAGKSIAAQVKAVHAALAHPDQTVLVVSSGQRMSSDFGTQLLTLVRQSALRDHVRAISLEQVQFANGSAIKLLPANPDTIRGYHPRAGSPHRGLIAILDEACFLEQGEEIRKALEYALITTDRGQLYIVSSPSTIGSWVHRYVLQADDPEAGVRVIQCPSTANPHISAEEIARLRSTKNDLEFRAEVLGEWVDGACGLFSGLLDSNRVAADLPLPDRAVCALGVDLALSYSPQHDRNALAVVAKWWEGDPAEDEATYRLLEVVLLEQASDGELRAELRRLQARYGCTAAAIEQYQGKSLYEYSQSLGLDARLLAPTTGLQQSAFHRLHQLLRHQRLQLPEHLPATFFEEMSAFEYRREPGGGVSFGHPRSGAVHDDTCYALAWAIHALDLAPAQPDSPPPPHFIRFVPQ